MYILAFETSCDDTSVAIFKNYELLAMDTKSQIKIHESTWWVVPEVAAREHANSIFQVLSNVLEKTWLRLQEIDYIAVTVKPWLIPSLLTWITVAKTISRVLDKPLLEINHIEGHIFSNFLDRKREDITFPLVCLTVSWWHNEIYYMKNMWNLERLWWTTDDSAWEAFDKVAKMMQLWYPGWPIISKLSSEYESSTWDKKTKLFPRVRLDKESFDFSFSWLKSAVKREIDSRSKNRELTIEDKKEISYEFENAVCDVLAYKLVNAWEQKKVKDIMLAWWVSANTRLRDLISKYSIEKGFNFIYPKKLLYCMDNAAMIWINAYYKIIDS